jgi:hypothetical protein
MKVIWKFKFMSFVHCRSTAWNGLCLCHGCPAKCSRMSKGQGPSLAFSKEGPNPGSTWKHFKLFQEPIWLGSWYLLCKGKHQYTLAEVVLQPGKNINKLSRAIQVSLVLNSQKTRGKRQTS